MLCVIKARNSNDYGTCISQNPVIISGIIVNVEL